ncbi:MAG: helicase, partial [Akkermansiaceae bacterium]|nr:helicase [Akkermansiaceae bacterium]
GDVFVLAGKTVKLVDAGVGEIFVENAAGRLPTVPAWNANKMPLASGLAREVRALRGEIDRRLDAGDDRLTDWLAERWNLSKTNAFAVVEHFENQRLLSEIPTEDRMLVEAFRDEESDPDRVHYFFHTLIGRAANDALSRILSHRVKVAVGGNALVTIDDHGFLLSLRGFQEMGVEEWRELFRASGAAEDLAAALEGSQLVKWQFGGVAQTGLMVPRNLPGAERKLRQIRWSADILFKVLSEHEPDHPLLRQAYREATHTFLDFEGARAFLETAGDLDWRFVEVPAVTPFSFGIYASKIREGMMMEDPDEAIERLHRAMREKLAQTAPKPDRTQQG